MRTEELLHLAGRVAVTKADRRIYHLGAVGVRSDGAIVVSPNGPSPHVMPAAHAEARLARKLDRGAVVYVSRVRRADGGPALARPCAGCQRVLRARGVRRIHYTISEREYGTIYFDR